MDKYSYYTRKKQLIELMGGRCKSCWGVEKLQFDHIDPTTKEFTLTQRMGIDINKLLLEASKCQLLCAICHKKKTKKYIEDSLPATHGTVNWYNNHKCRCRHCRDAWAAYFKPRSRKYRAKNGNM